MYTDYSNRRKGEKETLTPHNSDVRFSRNGYILYGNAYVNVEGFVKEMETIAIIISILHKNSAAP